MEYSYTGAEPGIAVNKVFGDIAFEKHLDRLELLKRQFLEHSRFKKVRITDEQFVEWRDLKERERVSRMLSKE